MAGKKKTTNLKGPKKLNLKALKASDVLCPICRNIFIEPVTLPCQHAFCNACFKDTMENANLVCPLCRTRVGSWYRKMKKQNKMIDELFWSAIKDTFPQEVQNKYDGLDSGIEEDKPVIKVADPGEIRTEYEIERKKDENERKKLKEAEEQASANLIKKLREEEEYRQAVEEEKMRLDAELARKLSHEMCPSTSKQKKTPKKSLGTLDKFLQTKHLKKPTTNNFSAQEHPSGVICLDKFPKNKQNGSKNLVMPVVQKKIQQIHRILETEDQTSNQPQDNSSASSSAHSNTSSSAKLDSRLYFKPIEIFKRSSVSKTVLGKLPIKVLSQRVNVSPELLELFSPKAMKPLEKTIPSAFVGYSRSKKDNLPIHAEVQTSHKSPRKQSKIESSKKSAAGINTEVKGSEQKTVPKQTECKLASVGSQNINNLSINSPKRHNIARRIFQRKNSTLANTSGEDSPLLGFNKIKSSKVNSILSSTSIRWKETSSSKIQESNKRKIVEKISKIPKSTKTNNNFIHDESPISVSSTETFLGWPQNKSAKVGSNAMFQFPKSPKSTKVKKDADCPTSVSSTENLLGWPKINSDKVRSNAFFQSSKSQKSTKVKNDADGPTSVSSTESLLGWPKTNSDKVESNAVFQSPKSQKSTKVKNNADCPTSVSSTENLLGWPKIISDKVETDAKFQSPKLKKPTKIAKEVSSPASTFFGFNYDSSPTSDIFKLTKTKTVKVASHSPKIFKVNKSKKKFTSSASETETLFGFDCDASMNHKSSKTKQSKLLQSTKTASSSLDDSVTETLFGFDTGSSSKSKVAKSSKGQKSRSDFISHPDTNLTAALLNESLANQDSFLGFQCNQLKVRSHSDIVEDQMNSSITESFQGFENEDEIGKRLNSVSPEIGKSQIRQKRPAKRNGVFENKLNGLSPMKKGKFDQIENKMKKLQEEADLELARKLQAEFDAIARPTRTTRGAQRQVTLDDMLIV